MGEAARKETAMEAARSSDFDEAVARAVDARMAKVRDELFAMQSKATGLELLGPLMEQLGMRLADIADQNNRGDGRVGRRIDPEIWRGMQKSRAEMIDRIEDARRRGVMPMWRIRHKVVLDHSLIDPYYIDPATKAAKETEVGFDGIPNDAMIPLDDDAKAIHEAYRGWIGELRKFEPEDRLGITTSGNVVINGAVQMRSEVRAGDGTAKPRRQSVRVSHLDRSLGTPKHILGSIHPAVNIIGG